MARRCTKSSGSSRWEIGGKSGGEYPPYPLMRFPTTASRAGLRIGGPSRVPLDATPARQAKRVSSLGIAVAQTVYLISSY